MKLSDISTERRILLGALPALAHALFGSEHKGTPLTKSLMRTGLTCAESEVAETLLAVRNEKDRLAPDCKVCTHPCGRTAEYDLSELQRCDPEVSKGKLRLLELLIGIAKKNDTCIDFIFEGMRAFGEDYPLPALKLLISRAETYNS